MEKCIDDNKSNGINPFSDNAVLREPLAPLRGKMPVGQKGVLIKWLTPTVSPY